MVTSVILPESLLYTQRTRSVKRTQSSKLTQPIKTWRVESAGLDIDEHFSAQSVLQVREIILYLLIGFIDGYLQSFNFRKISGDSVPSQTRAPVLITGGGTIFLRVGKRRRRSEHKLIVRVLLD